MRARTVHDRLWPSLCEKSVRNEAVGKLFNILLRLAVKRDGDWDCASKSGGFVSIFPTGDMTPDFLHIDGRPRFAKQSFNDGKQVKIAAIDPDF